MEFRFSTVVCLVLLVGGCNLAQSEGEQNSTLLDPVFSLDGQCLDDGDCQPGYSECYQGVCRLSSALENPTYHQDIAPMIERACLGCHEGNGVGSFSFETYELVTSVGPLVEQAVASGSMPPWIADADCIPYVNDARLLEAEKQTFANWFANGMPEGDEVENPLSSRQFNSPLDRVDLEVLMDEPYVPVSKGWPEIYRCHTLEWPETETRFITGFEGEPGDDDAVHHIVYFVSPPGEQADHYRALDAADPEPGYKCEGGQFLYDKASSWLGTWAPGKVGSFGNYPHNTGIRVEPGSVVTALIHHDLSQGGGEGRTGFRVSLADEVEREARVIPWLDTGWVGSDQMFIPANETGVTHTYGGDLWGMAEERSIVLHGAAMHMHSRGASGSLSLDRADGSEQCLLSISNWTEDWQFNHVFEEALEFQPGDNLHISCTYDNTADKQPIPGIEPVDVYWGDLGLDEMCLGILFISYPAE